MLRSRFSASAPDITLLNGVANKTFLKQVEVLESVSRFDPCVPILFRGEELLPLTCKLSFRTYWSCPWKYSNIYAIRIQRENGGERGLLLQC